MSEEQQYVYMVEHSTSIEDTKILGVFSTLALAKKQHRFYTRIIQMPVDLITDGIYNSNQIIEMD